jgi:methionyl-tRNA formyltransferase
VKGVVFFGADEITFQIGKWCICNDIACTIIANNAQARKVLSNSTLFADAAKSAGITFVVVNTLSALQSSQAFAHSIDPLCISVGAPWFFTKEFLQSFGRRIYNLHGTRLPKERGGTLFSWQILMGIRTGMCVLHEVTEHIDDGPIVRYEEFLYPAQCRKPADYLVTYQQQNIQFLKTVLSEFNAGSLEFTPMAQPEYLASYLPRLSAEVNGWVDWSWNLVDIERFICAFDYPYPGARTRHRGRVVILRDVYAQSGDGFTHPFQAGLVYRNNGKWLNVSVNGGEIIICSVTDAEGRSLLTEIQPGDRLYSLHEEVAGGKRRVMKTAAGFSLQKNLI